MKTTIFLFLLCLLFLPVSGLEAGVYALETIERVMSGDTFKLESGKTVRLIGVDAPEDEVNGKAKEDSRRTGQDLDDIIKSASSVLILTYIFSCLANIIMRESRLQNYQPKFRAPLYPWIHIVGIIGFGFLLFEIL